MNLFSWFFAEQAFDPELGTLTQRLAERRRLTLHCSVNSTEQTG